MLKEEKLVWDELDKVFDELEGIYNKLPYFGKQNVAPIPPLTPPFDTTNSNEMSEFLKKYNELKVFVNSLEKDYRKLQEEFEFSRTSNANKQYKTREILLRVIDILKLLVKF